MFSEYIHAVLSKATYEIIDDPDPFYGGVPDLRGVWASRAQAEDQKYNPESGSERSLIPFRIPLLILKPYSCCCRAFLRHFSFIPEYQ
jgi:hypothetical protein